MALPWKWLIIDGWKSHGVPVYLVHALIDDLNARNPIDGLTDKVTYQEKDTTTCNIFLPGFASIDMPDLTFRLEGLSIDIPAHDVGSLLVHLRNAPRRTFKHGGGLGVGMDYYKFHGHAKCLVLTPDLRADLLAQMEARYEEAERLADQHLEQRKVSC